MHFIDSIYGVDINANAAIILVMPVDAVSIKGS